MVGEDVVSIVESLTLSRNAKRKYVEAIEVSAEALKRALVNRLEVSIYSWNAKGAISVEKYPTFINVIVSTARGDEKFANIRVDRDNVVLTKIGYLDFYLEPAKSEVFILRRRNAYTIYPRLKEFHNTIVKQVRATVRSVEALNKMVEGLASGETRKVRLLYPNKVYKYFLAYKNGVIISMYCSPPENCTYRRKISETIKTMVRNGIVVTEILHVPYKTRGGCQWRETYFSPPPPPMKVDSVKTYECCGRDWLAEVVYRYDLLGRFKPVYTLRFTPLTPPSSRDDIREIASEVLDIIADVDGEYEPRGGDSQRSIYVDAGGRFEIETESLRSERARRLFASGFSAALESVDTARVFLRARTISRLIREIVGVGESV